MLQLSNLFSDHGVLQRDMPLPVWGWTAPRTSVSIRLGQLAEVTTMSGEDGKFLVRLPAQPAGGPYALSVTAQDETIEVHDLYLGEVWLAGGQSNMEMPLKGFQLPVFDREKLYFPTPVRMLTVPRVAQMGRVQQVGATWTLPTPAELEEWSAVGAFFAARLSAELQVPVGIIATNWGGTFAEAWTSRETLHANPDFTAAIDAYEASTARPAYWQHMQQLGLLENRPITQDEFAIALLKTKYPAYPANTGFERGWAAPGCDDSAWETIDLPGSWQAQGGHHYNGAFWFRCQVEIPQEWVGRELVLGIGAADKHDVTYVNGVEVGATGTDFETEHWSTRRIYPVPAGIVTSVTVTVAVRVYSFMFDGGLIGPAEAMTLAPADAPGSALSLARTWRYQEELNIGPTMGMTMGVNNPNTFSILYDNMIYPLLPYAVRGAIWYQGESNSTEPERYERLMRELIGDWRYHWGQSEFAFLQVLLAGYQLAEISSWPEIREAQVRSAEATGTGYASAVDVGDDADIHPRDKRTVGTRLALRALHDVYALPVAAYGPSFRQAQRCGDRIRIELDHADGLYARGGNPGGWELAGADGKFVPAQAQITGDAITVHAESVKEPRQVRYAWRENPQQANLYNQAELPMVPFRAHID